MTSFADTGMKHVRAPSGQGGRIVLVLDDDPLVRWSLGNALEKAGIHVKAAGSGEEALRLLEEIRFDAIITDMELPRMDGFAVTAAGRRCTEGIPVIMVTASGDEAARTKAAALGINHFVDKPFDLDEIVDLVKKLFAGPD